MQQRSYSTGLPRARRSDYRSVSDNEPGRIDAQRHIFCCGQPPETQVHGILFRKNRKQLFWRCEMHRVVKTGIGADATLEAPRAPINLA
ncbi:MAG: hypothetical protein OXU77_02690 [Gammaproteobacteria bacterium]|nr:hypothetical protein [Gammaproteobacteria bacterium]